ncbi:MAG: hypothetical protein LC135_10300 [Phycisphaerae bacterium]|nr:hypothetical protein [Phycisphaerae bacterium]MCZ2400239.1 hypothetical protein [Phycisphaerae bacterium]NUQ50794.1 hypothetical protein [Phycisphaerae bacterium]
MNAPRTRPSPEHTPEAERVWLRTYRQRSRRIWRQLVLVAVVTVVIVILSLAQRDLQAQRWERRELDRLAESLQSRLATEGGAVDLVALMRLDDPLWNRYQFNDGYARQGWRGSEIGVGCSRSVVALFLKEDGRFVLLFDGAAYRVEWLTEREFRRRAASLGLELALRDG